MGTPTRLSGPFRFIGGGGQVPFAPFLAQLRRDRCAVSRRGGRRQAGHRTGERQTTQRDTSRRRYRPRRELRGRRGARVSRRAGMARARRDRRQRRQAPSFGKVRRHEAQHGERGRRRRLRDRDPRPCQVRRESDDGQCSGLRTRPSISTRRRFRSPTSVEPVRPISSISAAVGPRFHLPNAPVSAKTTADPAPGRTSRSRRATFACPSATRPSTSHPFALVPQGKV